MAEINEASPICRGKNLSWETVLLFFNNMPRESMPKAEFHSFVESKINGWTQTHSQIARQLAFYYEKDGICYPRFTGKVSYADLFLYMQNWASKYFIPNPYAPSLKGKKPTCIYSFVRKSILEGNKDFDNALDTIFDVKLSSHDKVNVYLSNFTDIIIDGGHEMSLSERTMFKDAELYPDEELAIDVEKYFDYFSIQLTEKEENVNLEKQRDTHQQIYYGAPGTGKSYKINEITKSTKNFTRTTFHPDSDYSTFVGCYKPTMEPTGTIVGGKEQKKISYSYVAQAFLQAYTAAWKNTSEPYYLIIEEINRGNCAQIFGDLFQLLDRDEEGMSSYGITPDKDIANYLKNEFAKSEIENADIKSGNTMMLPSNLYILATMNTSDQSLFPIDSAFKRRWDWEYVPIEDVGKKHYIKVGNKKYDWWTFIDTINNSIDHITGSEDKKMGYWFVKPQNNDREITAKQFVGKVLFYLWNDVYKDYFDMSQCIFKIKNEDGTDEKKPFTYFFGSEADKRIQAFMAYNKIPFITIEDNVDVEDDDDNEDNDGKEATDTETQMKQRNLWTLFNQIMKSKGRNEASREAQGKSKYDIRFKTTGMFIRNTVHVVGNSTTPASVYSEIHFKPTAQNLYEVIESKKDELQELFELPIVWRNPNGTHVGKIERQVNFNDENDKEAGMTWLAETSAKLYDYLKPIVDENK